MKNRHRWILMLLALCSAALLTGSVAERRELAVEARVDALQEDLAGEVFRFHVIANPISTPAGYENPIARPALSYASPAASSRVRPMTRNEV